MKVMPDLGSASTAGFLRGARWGRDIDEGTSRADLPVGVQARAETIVLPEGATTVGDGAFFRDAEFADADEPLVETQLPPGEFRSAELRNKVAEKDKKSYHSNIDLETAIAAAFADLASESEIKRRAKQVALSIAKSQIESSGKTVATAFGDASESKTTPAEMPPIPTEKYVAKRGRGSKGNVVEFIETYWRAWLELGALTTPVLSSNDESCYNAWRYFLKVNGLPSHWKERGWSIPTLGTLITTAIADEERVREAARLSRAATRRKHR